MRTRWFWLSFADPDLPRGSQFTIIPVTKRGLRTIEALDERIGDSKQQLAEEGLVPA